MLHQPDEYTHMRYETIDVSQYYKKIKAVNFNSIQKSETALEAEMPKE